MKTIAPVLLLLGLGVTMVSSKPLGFIPAPFPFLVQPHLTQVGGGGDADLTNSLQDLEIAELQRQLAREAAILDYLTTLAQNLGNSGGGSTGGGTKGNPFGDFLGVVKSLMEGIKTVAPLVPAAGG